MRIGIAVPKSRSLAEHLQLFPMEVAESQEASDALRKERTALTAEREQLRLGMEQAAREVVAMKSQLEMADAAKEETAKARA